MLHLAATALEQDTEPGQRCGLVTAFSLRHADALGGASRGTGLIQSIAASGRGTRINEITVNIIGS